MFSNLQQYMQPQAQDGQQMLRPDPIANAGMLIISGMLPQEAYVQGAKMAREQEMLDLERQKYAQQQQQMVTAAKILQEGGGLADMLAAGINNPAILGALPQPQWVPNKGDPAGGRFVTPGNTSVQSNMGNMSNMGNVSPNLGGGQQRYDEFDNSELGTKAAMQLKAKRAEKADEYVAEVLDQGQKARAVIHTADQLETLIPKLFTNETLDAETKEKWSTRLGINKENVQASQIFEGEVSNIIGEIERQVKDGRATDAAAQIIIDAKPRKGNSPEANTSLVRAIKARGIALDEQAEAMVKWKDQGRDPLKFKDVWAAYERKNPILKLNKDGTITVNQANLSKWRKVIFGEETGEVNETRSYEPNDMVLRNQMIEKILRDRGEL